MNGIAVRTNNRQYDSEQCLLCTLEAECIVEIDSGQSVSETALCPGHLQELVDEAKDWLGGEQ